MDKKKMELVSIIVPIYKVELYMDECVESIVNQTYKKIEIILVDDGSPDSCPKKCDEWAKRDSRIRVIHKKNGGLSDARNIGIEEAKADFIAFVDSDDVINCEMIEKLYCNMIKENADLSVCNLKCFVDGEDTININEKIPSQHLITFSNNEKFENLFNRRIGITVIAPNKLYRKKLFENIRFPKGKFHEDVYVIHRILDKANKVVYSYENLYHYRMRKNSITASFSLHRLDELDGLKDRVLFFFDNYKNTRLYELALTQYCDKLIRIYCLLCDNNLNGVYKNELKMVKKEFNMNYKKILNISKKIIKKFKYTIFRYFPKVFYTLNKRKYR